MIREQTAVDVHVTGRRVVATLVDAVVFSIVSGAASLGFGVHPTGGLHLSRLSSGGSTLLLVVALLYYILLEGLTGRTLGKLVTGIRVIDERTGGTPTMLSAVLRTLFRGVDGIGAYLLGFIVVQVSKDRRRVGDMVARTLVVRA